MKRATKFWLLAAAVAVVATVLSLPRAAAPRGRAGRTGNPPRDAAQPSAGANTTARHPGIPVVANDGDLPFPAASDDETIHGARARLEAVAPGTDDLAEAASPGEASPSRDAREPPIFDLLRNSKNVPISPRVRDLAEEITRDATNAVGKARAIYDWLTRNIVYDTAEWESIASGATNYIHDHDPDAVLARGTTVCIGYAWLFDDLCEAAGINATWLIGDVRGYRGTADDALVSDIRHAWNAVELEDGEWHLLDATWGALQEGEAETALSAARADYYFDTPPGQFVFDHLPENESWQLLDEAIPSETAFSVLPNLKPAFFTNGLRLGDDYTSVLRAQAGSSAALSFSAPAGTQTAATLGSASDPESFGRIRVAKVPGDGQGGGGQAALLPSLPSGEYVLRLYSGKATSGVLECSADFLIRVE